MFVWFLRFLVAGSSNFQMDFCQQFFSQKLKFLHHKKLQDGTMALRDMSWILLEMPCGSWIISPLGLMCYRTWPFAHGCDPACVFFFNRVCRNIWCGEQTTVVVFVAIKKSFNIFVFMALFSNIWSHDWWVIDLVTSDENPWQERIGVTGVSLGGMASWLLAAADERVYAAAPAIGVQSFHHAVEHVPQLYQSKRYISWLHRHIVKLLYWLYNT